MLQTHKVSDRKLKLPAKNSLPLKSLHPPLLLKLNLNFGFLGHLARNSIFRRKPFLLFCCRIVVNWTRFPQNVLLKKTPLWSTWMHFLCGPNIQMWWGTKGLIQRKFLSHPFENCPSFLLMRLCHLPVPVSGSSQVQLLICSLKSCQSFEPAVEQVLGSGSVPHVEPQRVRQLQLLDRVESGMMVVSSHQVFSLLSNLIVCQPRFNPSDLFDYLWNLVNLYHLWTK